MALEHRKSVKLVPVFSAAAVIFLAINYRVIFDGFTLVRGAEAMFTDAVGGQELDIYRCRNGLRCT